MRIFHLSLNLYSVVDSSQLPHIVICMLFCFVTACSIFFCFCSHLLPVSASLTKKFHLNLWKYCSWQSDIFAVAEPGASACAFLQTVMANMCLYSDSRRKKRDRILPKITTVAALVSEFPKFFVGRAFYRFIGRQTQVSPETVNNEKQWQVNLGIYMYINKGNLGCYICPSPSFCKNCNTIIIRSYLMIKKSGHTSFNGLSHQYIWMLKMHDGWYDHVFFFYKKCHW